MRRALNLNLNTTNRELPLIVGQLPVLPKHFWQNKDFAAAGLEIPLGSGPYVIKKWMRAAPWFISERPTTGQPI